MGPWAVLGWLMVVLVAIILVFILLVMIVTLITGIKEGIRHYKINKKVKEIRKICDVKE